MTQIPLLFHGGVECLCNGFGKSTAPKEMKPEGLQLTRMILMTKHSGHFHLDFEFGDHKKLFTQENMSNEKADR